MLEKINTTCHAGIKQFEKVYEQAEEIGVNIMARILHTLDSGMNVLLVGAFSLGRYLWLSPLCRTTCDWLVAKGTVLANWGGALLDSISDCIYVGCVWVLPKISKVCEIGFYPVIQMIAVGVFALCNGVAELLLLLFQGLYQSVMWLCTLPYKCVQLGTYIYRNYLLPGLNRVTILINQFGAFWQSLSEVPRNMLLFLLLPFFALRHSVISGEMTAYLKHIALFDMATLPICMMVSPAGAISLLHLAAYTSIVGAWVAGGYLFGTVLMRGNWITCDQGIPSVFPAGSSSLSEVPPCLSPQACTGPSSASSTSPVLS